LSVLSVTNIHPFFHLFLFSSISAFVWDSVRLEFEAANNCELRTRGALFGRSAYGIGLRKGSAWTPHISQAILRLSESLRKIKSISPQKIYLFKFRRNFGTFRTKMDTFPK